MVGHREVRRPAAEDGQSVVGVLMVVAMVGAVVLALGRLGATVVASARADAAADAAALAAVGAGPAAARRVAASNGATVLAVRVEPGWATVTVVVGGRRAGATAVLTPVTGP